MNINDIQVNEDTTGYAVIVYYENFNNITFDSYSENSAMHFITSKIDVGSVADETSYHVYQ